VGGTMYEGTDDEVVFQQSVFSRKGVDRILKYAFELAQTRAKRHLTSATKSNGISITMPYWDKRVKAMAAKYPDVHTDQFHIDILAAHFVRFPDRFDVVVGSNLFGDILSDLGPAVCGTIGIAPSANINPERVFPSLFEPVHGSAPDIAGKGVATRKPGPRYFARSRACWPIRRRPARPTSGGGRAPRTSAGRSLPPFDLTQGSRLPQPPFARAVVAALRNFETPRTRLSFGAPQGIEPC
jgi:isocitrate dehydrogenase